MPNLHDLLTASVAADVTALAGESAPRAVRARIGAVRTRRAVVAGGGATVAIGAAAFAGLSDAGRTALQSATLAAGDGTITIPLEDATMAQEQPYATCGEPAPSPRLTSAGYALDPGVGTDGGLAFSPILTYDGDPYEAVTVEEPEALVLADGVVVASFGSSLSYPQSPLAVSAGYSYAAAPILVGEDSSAYSLCSEGTGADGVLLPAGDYEVVLVQSVHRSDAALAVSELSAAGFPIAPSIGSWVPGSIDCEEAVRNDIEGFDDWVPVQCEPFGVEGVTFDEAEGTVTIPLAPHVGEGDVDVMLASEPYVWTLTDDLTAEDLGVFQYTTGLEVGDGLELACGIQEQDWWGYPLLATTEQSFEDFMAGGGELAIDIDMLTQEQQAEISLDPTAEAWVLWRRGGTVRIAAHATATLTDGELSIDRAVDYARTSLTLDDIEWCEDPFLTGTDYRAEGEARRILIVTPSTITGTNGGIDHGEVMVVELPLVE